MPTMTRLGTSTQFDVKISEQKFLDDDMDTIENDNDYENPR